jgi:DNA-binding ferritin-like protein
MIQDINTYIAQNTSAKENNIREFSLYLCDILSSFKILHWYSKDYNFHNLTGKFYEDFDELFDSLMEEIIGVYNNKNICFSVSCPERDLKKINQCICLKDQIDEAFSTLDSLESTIKSEDMSEFVSSSCNGINNLIEEILSLSNKFKYLSSMLQTEDQKTTLIPLKDLGA